MAKGEDVIGLIFDGPPQSEGPGPRLLRIESPGGDPANIGAWAEETPGEWTFVVSARDIHEVNSEDLTDKEEFDRMMQPDKIDERARDGLVNGFYQLANSRQWSPADYLVQMRNMLDERIAELQVDRAALLDKRPRLKWVIPVPLDEAVENPFVKAYEQALDSLEAQVMQIDVWLATMKRSRVLLEGFKDQEPVVQH